MDQASLVVGAAADWDTGVFFMETMLGKSGRRMLTATKARNGITFITSSGWPKKSSSEEESQWNAARMHEDKIRNKFERKEKVAMLLCSFCGCSKQKQGAKQISLKLGQEDLVMLFVLLDWDQAEPLVVPPNKKMRTMMRLKEWLSGIISTHSSRRSGQGWQILPTFLLLSHVHCSDLLETTTSWSLRWSLPYVHGSTQG